MFKPTLKRSVVLWGLIAFLAFGLDACTPVATADNDPASFRYVQTLKGVELVAKGAPMTEGFADVIGLGVVLDSPYCVDSCVAGEDWVVEIELPPGSYGSRVVVPVVEGDVLGGHAVVTLAGADESFQATLRLR